MANALQVRLKPRMSKKLAELAAERGLTKSELVRALIDSAYEKERPWLTSEGKEGN